MINPEGFYSSRTVYCKTRITSPKPEHCTLQALGPRCMLMQSLAYSFRRKLMTCGALDQASLQLHALKPQACARLSKTKTTAAAPAA